MEAELQTLVARGFTIDVGATYLNARYVDYPNAAINVPTPGGGISTGTEDLGGSPLARAPDFTSYLSANYETRIGGDWTVGLSGVVRYSSAYDIYPGAGGPMHWAYQPSYTLMNISGYVSPPGSKYRVGFYVNNLTDTRYWLIKDSYPYGNLGAYAQPITYGLRVRYDF